MATCLAQIAEPTSLPPKGFKSILQTDYKGDQQCEDRIKQVEAVVGRVVTELDETRQLLDSAVRTVSMEFTLN